MVNERNANDHGGARTREGLAAEGGNEDGWRNEHAADAENADDGEFGALIHAQVPDQRHR